MSQGVPPNKGLVGVLDIGSNSVRLLVADISKTHATPKHFDMITCRLLSKAENGLLARESIDRTIEAIKKLTGIAREQGANAVIGFGTCAMREGVNSHVVVEEARKLGVDIEVLSGPDEALMAYQGVARTGKNGIIDIGGGSTELTVGENDRVISCASVPIGAVRLFESSGSLGPGELVSIAREALTPAWEAVARENPPAWTGVGGTITTLASLSQGLEEYKSELVNGYVLKRREVQNWLAKLCQMSLDERKSLKGMRPNRADIIPFGTAILASFFELSRAQSISVTENDNMMGYLRLKYLSLSTKSIG